MIYSFLIHSLQSVREVLTHRTVSKVPESPNSPGRPSLPPRSVPHTCCCCLDPPVTSTKDADRNCDSSFPRINYAEVAAYLLTSNESMALLALPLPYAWMFPISMKNSDPLHILPETLITVNSLTLKEVHFPQLNFRILRENINFSVFSALTY